MPRTAFVSDFDSTLFFMRREPHVSSEDITAIGDFRRGGGLFGACTGRPYLGLLDASYSLVGFDFYIVSGGAQILDGRGVPLYETRLERCLVEDLCREIRTSVIEEDAPMVIQANERLYSFAPNSDFQIRICSIDDIPGDRFFGISFYASSPEAASRIAESMTFRRPEVHAFHNNAVVDVVSARCSKGKSLLLAKKLFGIERIGAIGDSFNDVPMLEAADQSFTFFDSPEAVRKKAGCLVRSAAEALSIFSGTGADGGSA